MSKESRREREAEEKMESRQKGHNFQRHQKYSHMAESHTLGKKQQMKVRQGRISYEPQGDDSAGKYAETLHFCVHYQEGFNDSIEVQSRASGTLIRSMCCDGITEFVEFVKYSNGLSDTSSLNKIPFRFEGSDIKRALDEVDEIRTLVLKVRRENELGLARKL
jgi:hypothetical protein